MSFDPINAEMCQMSCQTSLLSVWEGPGLQEQNGLEKEEPGLWLQAPTGLGVSHLSVTLQLALPLRSVRRTLLRNVLY